jgi:inward rectifier potassium channel
MKSYLRKKKPQPPVEGEFKDFGLGTKVASQRGRMINRDGSFNVERRGVAFLDRFSFFHTLIRTSWWNFNALVLGLYIAVNAGFAGVYLAIGMEHIAGAQGASAWDQFLEAFFFSTQTFTTVGYGRVSPVGFLTNAIASFESMAGLMFFALATGLLYGRFSRPNVKIIFSKQAVVAPYRDKTGFMFRIVNGRDNQLIDVEILVALSRKENPDPNAPRRFHELSLERTTVNFFPLAWTVVHPIDENSPLHGITQQDLEESDAEFLILFKAFDDTFSQSVHTRSSYRYDEVVVGAKFVSIYVPSTDGASAIDLEKLHDFERVSLPGDHFSRP